MYNFTFIFIASYIGLENQVVKILGSKHVQVVKVLLAYGSGSEQV